MVLSVATDRGAEDPRIISDLCFELSPAFRAFNLLFGTCRIFKIRPEFALAVSSLLPTFLTAVPHLLLPSETSSADLAGVIPPMNDLSRCTLDCLIFKAARARATAVLRIRSML